MAASSSKAPTEEVFAEPARPVHAPPARRRPAGLTPTAPCRPIEPGQRRPRRRRHVPSTSTCCCDVDGVLYPLPELFTPYAAERLGRDLELDTTNWEFYTEWGLGYDDFVELLGEGVRERKLWWTGAPYADVVPAIDRIRAGGHRIHLVTARDVRGIEAEALDATRHWLDRHGIDADTITLAQDKTSVLDRLGLDPATCVAVDDGPHHIEAFEAVGVFGDRARSLGQLPRRPPDRHRPRRRRRPDSQRGRPDAADERRSSAGHAPGRWPNASPSVRRVLPAVVMVIRAIDVGLGAAVRRRLLHRALARRGHAHNPLVGAWSMGSREVGVVDQQPRPAAARPARPVHQARPVLGHRARRRVDQHRRRSSACGW